MKTCAGRKVRSPSTVGNDVLAALEAVPVSLPVSDTYDAIERSIVEGTLLPISTLISFNLGDVVEDVLGDEYVCNSAAYGYEQSFLGENLTR
ncbi:MAG: hypothetical protein ACOX1I_05685 [Dethiobacteria bacterium]